METIYLLRDPRDGAPRYVGVTSRALQVRMTQHAYQARCGEKWPVHDWHRKLISLGLAPVVEIIEVTHDRKREEYWIAYYKANYPKMLNISPGGNVPPSSDPKVAAKISAALTGRKIPPEVVAKVVAARAGFRHSEATREKMRKPKSPEHATKAADGVRKARSSGNYRVLRGDDNPSRQHPERMARGSKNPASKLTDAKVASMRAEYSAGASTVVLAAKYGITQAAAWRIVRRKAWKHVPGGDPVGRGRGCRKSARNTA